MIFSKVTSTLLRGPRPDDLAELQAIGVKHIINLESGIYEVFHEDKLEQQHPPDFGMTYWDLGCSDISPPEKRNVLKFFEIVGKATTKKEIAFVHCLSGKDRTGFVCAAYRMAAQHWTYDAAYAEWKSMGRHWWYDWWKTELRKWQIV